MTCLRSSRTLFIFTFVLFVSFALLPPRWSLRPKGNSGEAHHNPLRNGRPKKRPRNQPCSPPGVGAHLLSHPSSSSASASAPAPASTAWRVSLPFANPSPSLPWAVARRRGNGVVSANAFSPVAPPVAHAQRIPEVCGSCSLESESSWSREAAPSTEHHWLWRAPMRCDLKPCKALSLSPSDSYTLFWSPQRPFHVQVRSFSHAQESICYAWPPQQLS